MKNETTTRTFEFTVEKTETFTIRRNLKIVINWCSDCGREVRMSPPEDAARITGISARKIYSGIENGNTHFAQLAEGFLLVCIDSLN